MRTNTYISLTIVALLTFSLTGCRTTRHTEGTIALTKKQRTELLAPLAKYPADVQTVTSKATIALDYEGHTATVKGRLRMRRDEVVQMSITALGLMEVALIEFTPKGAYLIDRVNKRYALLDYSSGMISYAGINFSTIQALFWNRLFITGEKEPWSHPEDFALTATGTRHLIEPHRQRMLKCKFYTDTDYRLLLQTDLRLQHHAATWRYGEFDSIGTYTYPTIHEVSVSSPSHALGIRISLTGVSTLDTGWSSTTDLSRYKEVDLEQLMSITEMIR